MSNKLLIMLAPLALLGVLLLSGLAWWSSFYQPVQSADELITETDKKVDLASLIDFTQSDSVSVNRNWLDGELQLLSAPPWTSLDKADLAKLAEGAGGDFSGILPELPPQERKKLRDEALESTDEISRYFPYMYTGAMQVRGEYHVLIEDADTGSCYFRKIGEKLGKFSVVEVTATVVTLVHDKNGKQVRLLKTARGKTSKTGKSYAGSQEN